MGTARPLERSMTDTRAEAGQGASLQAGFPVSVGKEVPDVGPFDLSLIWGSTTPRGRRSTHSRQGSQQGQRVGKHGKAFPALLRGLNFTP